MTRVLRAIEELQEYVDKRNREEGKKGPYGCKCQTLAHHLTGDGCDECNPEYAKQFEDD